MYVKHKLIGAVLGTLCPGDTPSVSIKPLWTLLRNKIKGCENIAISDLSDNKTRFKKNEYESLLIGQGIGERILQIFPGIRDDEIRIKWETYGSNKPSPTIYIKDLVLHIDEMGNGVHPMDLKTLLSTNVNFGKNPVRSNLFLEEIFGNYLDDWYLAIRDLIIEKLRSESFEVMDRGKYLKLAYSEDTLILDINGYRETIEGFSASERRDFLDATTKKYRESILRRFFDTKIGNDKIINKHKNLYLNNIGDFLISEIDRNISEDKKGKILSRFFPVKKDKYIYAITSEEKIDVYILDNLSIFQNIDFSNTQYSVVGGVLQLSICLNNKLSSRELILKYLINCDHIVLGFPPKISNKVEGDILSLCSINHDMDFQNG